MRSNSVVKFCSSHGARWWRASIGKWSPKTVTFRVKYTIIIWKLSVFRVNRKKKRALCWSIYFHWFKRQSLDFVIYVLWTAKFISANISANLPKQFALRIRDQDGLILSENGFPKCRYIILLKCTAKMSNCIEEETDRREGKGRRCCWGTEFVQLHAALQIQHQDDLKKRMLQRNGRSSGSHHHPPKMDVLPKTVL